MFDAATREPARAWRPDLLDAVDHDAMFIDTSTEADRRHGLWRRAGAATASGARLVRVVQIREAGTCMMPCSSAP